MKWKDIKQMSEDELKKALKEARAELIDLRFKVSTGTLKHVHKIGETRKNVARVLTRLANLGK